MKSLTLTRLLCAVAVVRGDARNLVDFGELGFSDEFSVHWEDPVEMDIEPGRKFQSHVLKG